ncbi:EamA family transporter [Polycladomyces subterraneus]|uniref:EamA family transporter n=1 Tax=Polycladomyces subterraneus TaxID=1016997 RepID=A0ABT8ISC0_9BACL|nr:EamA family transporter [Polycladomyces subterraneus]MDN4595351.1 EamA family transporter [Polycladomyces subterraneus]
MNKEIVYALLAALSFGIAPVFEKLGLARTDPTLALFVRASVTTVLVTSFLVTSGKAHLFRSTDVHSLVFVVLGGIFGVLFAQFFYFKALQYGEIGRVMPIVGGFPVIAYFFSIFVFGESVTLTKLMGIVLVVAGVLLLGDTKGS